MVYIIDKNVVDTEIKHRLIAIFPLQLLFFLSILQSFFRSLFACLF